MTMPEPKVIQKYRMLRVSVKTSIAAAAAHMKNSPVKPSSQFGFAPAGGSARKQRWKKAWDGGEIAAVTFSLRLQQRRLFAKNQAAYEEEHRDGHKQKSDTACEHSNSYNKEKIPEIKGIADAAIRPVGHELFTMKRGVMNDGAVQIGSAQERIKAPIATSSVPSAKKPVM